MQASKVCRKGLNSVQRRQVELGCSRQDEIGGREGRNGKRPDSAESLVCEEGAFLPHLGRIRNAPSHLEALSGCLVMGGEANGSSHCVRTYIASHCLSLVFGGEEKKRMLLPEAAVDGRG